MPQFCSKKGVAYRWAIPWVRRGLMRCTFSKTEKVTRVKCAMKMPKTKRFIGQDLRGAPGSNHSAPMIRI